MGGYVIKVFSSINCAIGGDLDGGVDLIALVFNYVCLGFFTLAIFNPRDFALARYIV